MQIFSPRTVKLSFSCLTVDSHSWLSATTIEPECDVSPCSLNEGSCERIGYIFLDDCGKIVDLSEKSDPTIIGVVVLTDLLGCVVSLFG